MGNIYEELTSYCGCGCNSDDKTNKKNIDELIHLVSSMTCWNQSGFRDKEICKTFLRGKRREVLKINPPRCSSDCNIFRFEPFYHPYDIDSFTFTVVEERGLKENGTPLLGESYLYSETDKLFKIELPITCKCYNPCDCQSIYKLVVEYEAGYCNIPECLLPAFCKMLDLINKKNDCGCCKDCGCNSEPNTENKPDYGEYNEGDALSFAIVEELGTLLTKQYKNELSLISLCKTHSFFGVVI